ncbi:MAG: SUMF1/EgtB/PvdO family nonheme iron enzyme [Paraprevotella sp.]|nr:SUMF1/EgtB/PvdO family nonheme iron enzyme [Paraprevotella sp.]
MTTLYINKSFCLSIEQLRGYFAARIDINSDLYWDLLDYGRNHGMSEWLQEMGEEDLACRLEAIDNELGDSAFFAEMSRIILGKEIQTPIKPDFSQCFSVENIQHEVMDTGITVTVYLKVLMPVNESFELKVQTNWGTRRNFINPFHSRTGELLKRDFSFRRRLNCDSIEIELFVDDKKYFRDKYHCGKKMEFEVNGVSFNMIKIDGTRSLLKKDFYIGETLVTQNLWNAVMGSVPCQVSCEPWRIPTHIQIDTNKPIVNISLFDIQKFIGNLNRILGRTFRLPMDSEWAYAVSDDLSNLDEIAWYATNSNRELHYVATKSPNTKGVYDLIGNVWEFVMESEVVRGGDYCTDIMGNPPIKKGFYSDFRTGFRLAFFDEESIRNIDFVDIGLSVLWGRNSGYSNSSGRIPTVEESEELLKKCEILNVDDDIVKVSGPNGQYLYMRSRWYPTSQCGSKYNSRYAFHLGYHQIRDIYDKNIGLGIYVQDKI